MKQALYAFLVLVCMSFPLCWRVFTEYRKGQRLGACLWHLTWNLCGTPPVMLGMAGYYAMQYAPDPSGAYIILIVLWTVVPLPLKFLGGRIFDKAANAPKAWRKLRWSFYVEMTMGCFGIAVFARYGGTLVLYSASLALSLMSCAAWPLAFRATEQASLQAMLDALVCFVARVASLTFLLLLVCFRLAADLRGDAVVLTRITGGAGILTDVTIYGEAPVSGDAAGACVGALAVTFVLFVVFCVLAPPALRCRGTARVVPIFHGVFPSVSVAEGGAEGTPPSALGVADSAVRWLDGGRGAYLNMCALMTAYLREVRGAFVFAAFFALNLTSLLAIGAETTHKTGTTMASCQALVG